MQPTTLNQKGLVFHILELRPFNDVKAVDSSEASLFIITSEAENRIIIINNDGRRAAKSSEAAV